MLTTNNKTKVLNLPKIFKDKSFIEVFHKIHQAGGDVALVGGVVRDILLNEKHLTDNISFDLATNLKPEKLINIFGKNIKYLDEGLNHGTVIIKNNNYIFETTSLRKDISTSERYASVIFQDNWKVDASRRDLTINAIYLDIDGNIYDPIDGIRDLMIGRVEFIGEMIVRLKEDYLRLLRYVRFYSKYSKFDINEKKINIIKKYSTKIKVLSKERIIDEQRRIFSEDLETSLRSAELMRKTNLDIECFGEKFELSKIRELKKILPKISWIKKISILFQKSNNKNLFKNLPISKKEREIFDNLQNFFTEKELTSLLSQKWKQNVYYLGKDVGLKLLLSAPFSSNIKKRFEDIMKYKKPKLPVNGKDLLDCGLEQGQKIGEVLVRIEKNWVKSNFILTKNELLSEIDNYN